MTANRILLQIKYSRIVEKYAKAVGVSLREALDVFYHSNVYILMSEGVSDFHCMSDRYLVEELIDEQKSKTGSPAKQ